MQKIILSVIVALGLSVGTAAPVDGQRRGDRDDDRYEREDDDRYGERKGRSEGDARRATGRRGDERGRSARHERGNGPAFCRSGAGHPVFGWGWCRERGWDRSGARAVRWEQRSWEDVIFRDPRRDRDRNLDQRGLADVLGDIVFGRIDTRRRELGSAADYRGRWTTSGNGTELWITAGGIPIARLVDRDGDHRVDAVWTAER